MMTMGERLQAALDARSKTAPQVIAACGLSKGGVYNILNDTTTSEKVRESTVLKITSYLRISRDWLVWGKGGMDRHEADDSGDSDWADIHATSQGLGLGSGVEADDYAETHKLKFRKSSLAKKRLKADRLEVAYGKGESMLPRIHDGDAVLFDTSDITPKDGHLYVILVEGKGDKPEPQVKRCLTIGSLMFFAADNPTGAHDWAKPRPLGDPKHAIRVLGRVRWIGSWEG